MFPEGVRIGVNRMSHRSFVSWGRAQLIAAYEQRWKRIMLRNLLTPDFSADCCCATGSKGRFSKNSIGSPQERRCTEESFCRSSFVFLVSFVVCFRPHATTKNTKTTKKITAEGSFDVESTVSMRKRIAQLTTSERHWLDDYREALAAQH